MKKKNTVRLNPDINSLLQLVKHANYQTFVFKNYQDPSPPPSQFGNGSERDVNGNTVSVVSTKGSVPDNIQNHQTIQTIQDKEESNLEIQYSDEQIISESDDELMDEL